jgi:four helix bundle protein
MRATRRSARSHRDLVAWQRAYELADCCLNVVERLHTRHAALAHQIRRSAVSVVSNIAEGNGRLSLADYLRHLRIAHGSLMELETQLLLAGSRHRDGEAALASALAGAAEVGRVLGGLIRSLERLAEQRRQARKGARGESPPTPSDR